jgi:hypothetical protein
VPDACSGCAPHGGERTIFSVIPARHCDGDDVVASPTVGQADCHQPTGWIVKSIRE